MLRKLLFFLLIPVLSGFFACQPTRYVPEGQHLVTRNIIQTDTNILEKERFDALLKQQPNRKILGLFRFHLGLYNLGNTGKPGRFKNWLREIGEAPVVLDSTITYRSVNQINLLLNKKGFFHAKVRDSVETYGKKAKVHYLITYKRPYYIRNIQYDSKDPNIINSLDFLRQTSLIKKGDRYDEDILDQERERITREMKDRGFYYFSRNYITFQVDTNLGNFQADLFLYINRINENIDPSLIGNRPVTNHETFYLRNIFIQTDYNPSDPAGSVPSDTTDYKGYYLIGRDSIHPLRDEKLVSTIFINSGDRYLQHDLDYTYKRLQDLNVFKFINISFSEVPRDSVQKNHLLDVVIQLTPTEKQDFTLEAEATNSGGNLGIAGSFGFRNKNVFRGAEVLELKVKTALEALPNFNDSVESKKLLFFNTFEIGPEVNLTFKQFLLPGFMTRKTSRYFNPRSNINTGFNFQERPDYKRSILNFNFGYNWQSSSTQRWIVQPVSINSVSVDPSPEFRARLDSLADPRLSYSYESHLIPSGRFSWIFNNQNEDKGKRKRFFYLRGNLELSGLLLRSLSPTLQLEKDELGRYLVGGIPFSQFIKPDIDISMHQRLNPNNTLVYRFATGAGFPFGNSTVLPFEKSFFAGGANSLRAWNARTLGPGSYTKTFNIEQSGDIKIEANVEYRSFLFRLMEGALLEGATFVDAGNIWTRNKDENRPGAEFKIGNVLPEMAIGAGFGLRFNFSFFILRLDAAVKLRDPSLSSKERWVYPNQKFVIGDITPNLAIGYPF